MLTGFDTPTETSAPDHWDYRTPAYRNKQTTAILFYFTICVWRRTVAVGLTADRRTQLTSSEVQHMVCVNMCNIYQHLNYTHGCICSLGLPSHSLRQSRLKTSTAEAEKKLRTLIQLVSINAPRFTHVSVSEMVSSMRENRQNRKQIKKKKII